MYGAVGGLQAHNGIIHGEEGWHGSWHSKIGISEEHRVGHGTTGR